MNKEQFLKEAKDRGYNFSKVIFHEQSPYQKRRFKKEYVGWEAWLYNGKSSVGFLITQESWDIKDKQFQLSQLEAFNN